MSTIAAEWMQGSRQEECFALVTRLLMSVQVPKNELLRQVLAHHLD